MKYQIRRNGNSDIRIGKDVFFEEDVTISGFHGEAIRRLVIGDNCYFGKDVNVACPELIMGDYVTIHKRTGIFGERPGVIGHNCWIAQDCILNTNGFLWVGNNVQIGAANHIWTHAAAGEVFEGCKIDYSSPTFIEDDVWICGGHSTINPGIRLSKRSIILPNSVIAHNTEPERVYRGAPAESMPAYYGYTPLEMKDRYEIMDFWVKEFWKEITKGTVTSLMSINREGSILHVASGSQVSNFDLFSKLYTKKRTVIEIEFIKYLKGKRARFLPEGNPIVGVDLYRLYNREEKI